MSEAPTIPPELAGYNPETQTIYFDRPVIQKPPMIYGKIADALAEVGTVGKNRRNQQQGYDFRSIDDFYDCLQPVLAKNRIFIAPTILEHTREERPTKTGGVMTTTLTKVRFKIFAEDGSFIEADALGEGADSGDKSANKAAAGAMKYLFMQVFSVRVSGESHDSENDSPQYAAPKPQAPPKAPPVQKNAPQVNSEQFMARPAGMGENIMPRNTTAADVLPKKATEKHLDRMISVLLKQFDGETLFKFAIGKGWLKPDDGLLSWPLDHVPTTKEAMGALTNEIAASLPKPVDPDELPAEIGNVVIHIPPADIPRLDYLKSPDTIKSLYARRKEDVKARTRLWGFAENFDPQGFNGNPPTEQDLKLRKALDAFSEWYAAKKGLEK